jgi:hypothetical protein
MSYHRFRSIAEAKRFTEQLDADRRAAQARVDERYERSKRWLDKYKARPQRTSFNWSTQTPAIPPIVTPINQGETNGKEIIEGEFTVLADADASREAGGREGPRLGGQAAAHDGVEHPARQGDGQAESPFIPF